MTLFLKGFVGHTLRQGDASFYYLDASFGQNRECAVNVMDVLALLQVWKAKQCLRIFFLMYICQENSKAEHQERQLDRYLLHTLQNYWHSSK